MSPPSLTSLLQRRDELTNALHAIPYDFNLYIQRATVHTELDYPDLAAGDAYRALLLTDEVEFGTWREEVCDAVRASRPGQRAAEDDKWIVKVAAEAAITAYSTLVKSLLACGDISSAVELARQGLQGHPKNERLQEEFGGLLGEYGLRLQSEDSCVPGSLLEYQSLRKGFARREIYPWNEHEPDRGSEHDLAFLNAELRKCAPKCEVRAVELPALHTNGDLEQGTIRQLGLFAREDIAPFETVLREPSILTANTHLHEPLCDACCSPFPSSGAIPCPSCSDTYFCSHSCAARAQEQYHNAVCGFEDFDIIAREPPVHQATDSLYLLLVVRAIAMSVAQDTHPLDLPQVRYLWGDFQHDARTLPFNFKTNVQHPIQILTEMSISPFEPASVERYDTWVLNTLFAKFRGVASAKMNTDLRPPRPDVAGVHWLWCLANHACAPNVRWEWDAGLSSSVDGPGVRERIEGEGGGRMGLIARGEDEVVHWGGREDSGTRTGGIRKGGEILSHYCDVGLDVKQRREWAAGALGGACRCERCVWEDAHERSGEGT